MDLRGPEAEQEKVKMAILGIIAFILIISAFVLAFPPQRTGQFVAASTPIPTEVIPSANAPAPIQVISATVEPFIVQEQSATPTPEPEQIKFNITLQKELKDQRVLCLQWAECSYRENCKPAGVDISQEYCEGARLSTLGACQTDFDCKQSSLNPNVCQSTNETDIRVGAPLSGFGSSNCSCTSGLCKWNNTVLAQPKQQERQLNTTLFFVLQNAKSGNCTSFEHTINGTAYSYDESSSILTASSNFTLMNNTIILFGYNENFNGTSANQLSLVNATPFVSNGLIINSTSGQDVFVLFMGGSFALSPGDSWAKKSKSGECTTTLTLTNYGQMNETQIRQG